MYSSLIDSCQVRWRWKVYHHHRKVQRFSLHSLSSLFGGFQSPFSWLVPRHSVLCPDPDPDLEATFHMTCPADSGSRLRAARTPKSIFLVVRSGLSVVSQPESIICVCPTSVFGNGRSRQRREATVNNGRHVRCLGAAARLYELRL